MHRAWLFLLVGCTVDADGDGFAASEDCNDDDPTVYPGARETEGDGFDSNCDGEDPAYRWTGSYTLVDYTATLAGIELIGGGAVSGSAIIREDFTVELNADLQAYGFDLPLEMQGFANPIPGEGAFNLELDGEIVSEIPFLAGPTTADFDCAWTEVEVLCDGSLLALGYNLDSDVTMR